MRLDLGIMAGEESKKFLVSLTEITTRLEKVARALRSPDELEAAEESEEEAVKPAKRGRPAKAKASLEDDSDEDAEESDDTEEEDEELSAKPAKKKAAPKKAAFEDDSDDSDEDEDEEEEKPAPKKAKGKKVSINDVNDACLARADDTSRKEVLALLQKNFGIEKSVTELEESDYAAVIELLKTAPKKGAK